MSDATKLACNIAFQEELAVLPDDYKNKLQDVFEAVPENFIRRSASSTKKYHSVTDCMEPWGLLLHTKAVVMVAKELIRCRDGDLIKYNNDVIVACILHDMCKYHLQNNMQEHTSRNHDVEGSMLANAAGFNTIVQQLIRCHSGIWNSEGFDSSDQHSNDSVQHLFTSGNGSTMVNFSAEVDNITELMWIVHYADIIASRRWININFDGLVFELNKQVLPMLGITNG